MSYEDTGYAVFDADAGVAAWAKAALTQASRIAADPGEQARNLRHGRTWFVGVDALRNAADGSLDGVALRGPWQGIVPNLAHQRAQLSIIYPSYPQQDPDESDANHRFRVVRGAAHVDGLLPVGADKRRFALEFHAYILGIPLNECTASPTLVWPGSHKIIAPMLQAEIGGENPKTVDITEAYKDARKTCFAEIEPVAVQTKPGGCFLIHRHALHGTAPWGDAPANAEGRMIAFLRPEFPDPSMWLA